MMKRGQVKNLKEYKTPQEEPAETFWVGATPGSVGGVGGREEDSPATIYPIRLSW